MIFPKVSIIDTLSGKYLIYSTNDGIGRILLTEGYHEKNVQDISKFIIETMSDNMLVLDIGANIGSYSIPLAIKFPNIKFQCFEIQKNVFHQLCGNIFLNSLSNIDASNYGVSNQNATIKIPAIDYSKNWNVGGYSIDELAIKEKRVDFPQETILGNVDAEVIRLDSLKFENIGLIKIDIEGHELDALKASLKLLRKNGYPPILFECWPFEWYEKKKNELLSFMREIGYTKISDIGTYNYLAQSCKTNHPNFNVN